LRAIEEARVGQVELFSSSHFSTSPAIFDCSRKRCLVSRTSRSVLPLMAERGSIRSVGSSTRVQFSHWSPRARS
jgi:hypothetical protein